MSIWWWSWSGWFFMDYRLYLSVFVWDEDGDERKRDGEGEDQVFRMFGYKLHNIRMIKPESDLVESAAVMLNQKKDIFSPKRKGKKKIKRKISPTDWLLMNFKTEEPFSYNLPRCVSNSWNPSSSLLHIWSGHAAQIPLYCFVLLSLRSLIPLPSSYLEKGTSRGDEILTNSFGHDTHDRHSALFRPFASSSHDSSNIREKQR